jgi:hypothetical protein
MKKLFSIIFGSLLIFNLESNAQSSYKPALQKGSWMVGGSLALSFGSYVSEYKDQSFTTKSEYSYTSSTNSPKGIYFLANGIGLGLGMDLTSTKFKAKEGDSETTQTQYLIGPVFRYYAPFGMFVHADVAFGKSKFKSSSGGSSNSDDSNQTKWQLGIGYAFFANDFVSIAKPYVQKFKFKGKRWNIREYFKNW